MNISSLCHRELVSISAEDSVRDAAMAMRQHHVGALALTDPKEPGKVVGIVTDRDLVVELLATGGSPEQSVASVATPAPVAVRSEAPVDEALLRMRQQGVRRLLVLDPDGGVRGLVSLDDLVEAVTREVEQLAATLRAGLERERERIDSRTRERGPSTALYLTRHEP